VNYVALFLV